MTAATKSRAIVAVISSLSGFLLGGLTVHLNVVSRLSAMEAEVRVLQGDMDKVLRVLIHQPSISQEGQAL